MRMIDSLCLSLSKDGVLGVQAFVGGVVSEEWAR